MMMTRMPILSRPIIQSNIRVHSPKKKSPFYDAAPRSTRAALCLSSHKSTPKRSSSFPCPSATRTANWPCPVRSWPDSRTGHGPRRSSTTRLWWCLFRRWVSSKRVFPTARLWLRWLFAPSTNANLANLYCPSKWEQGKRVLGEDSSF